jgi:hypothetical protein
MSRCQGIVLFLIFTTFSSLTIIKHVQASRQWWFVGQNRSPCRIFVIRFCFFPLCPYECITMGKFLFHSCFSSHSFQLFLFIMYKCNEGILIIKYSTKPTLSLGRPRGMLNTGATDQFRGRAYRFVVGKMTAEMFSTSTSVFPVGHHSTNAPYSFVSA